MEALIYLGIWAGVIFLMMRFGCGAHLMGHGRGRKPTSADGRPAKTEKLRWIAPSKDWDPVCGKTVNTSGAKPSVIDGQVYYFCSRECRERFEAAPETYIQGEQRQYHGRLEPPHA